MKRNYVYPFVAVISQDKVKKALILNVINPLIGGVLISGEKGTAKSTLVRGLAEILNDIEVVNLPLNITEDRLIGTIDIEKAISEGKRSLEAGILKEAHENILYVDEVNLLSEHIVNCLLEVSASGVNHVEREGVSVSHLSRFVLVGTMNPEEGNLRPQFLDRFGLYVEAEGSKDIVERKEIIKRRLAYENNPYSYITMWKNESDILEDKILKAKELINVIEVSESIIKLAAQLSNEANCEGHRAELVIIETARSIAAFDNRRSININDIKEAAELALPHRMRELPNENQSAEDSSEEQEEQEENNEKNTEDNNDQQEENNGDINEQSGTENQNDDENNGENSEADEGVDKEKEENNLNNNENSKDSNNEENSIEETIEEIGEIFSVKSLNLNPMDRKKRKGSGKRSKTKTDSKQGRYIRYVAPKEKLKDIAFDATLRAAAPYQSLREKNGLALAINRSDFREKLREKRTGNTILFVVDASGSMKAKKRMEAVKGAVVSLLTDAYQKRDKVGLIAFRKKEAQVLLNITRSVDLAQKSLKVLPTGGKTPLSAGLLKGYDILRAAKKKDSETLPVIVLVSDGRTNVAINDEDPFEEAIQWGKKIAAEGIQAIVIDSEQDYIKLGLAREIAEAMNAQYYKLDELESGQIAVAVKSGV